VSGAVSLLDAAPGPHLVSRDGDVWLVEQCGVRLCGTLGRGPETHDGGWPFRLATTDDLARAGIAQPPVTTPTPSVPTVRVRIAVAVAPCGAWSACGGSEMAEGEAIETAAYCMRGTHVVFVEADVPFPAPIAGRVAPTVGDDTKGGA